MLVVDEAHRLNEKSGMYQNLGENQMKEIIKASKLSVFFIDEEQRVTWKDVGRKEDIRQWAARCEADVTELRLASQFRCNGSDGYLAWIDHTLQIRETANWSGELGYDFRVFDDPNALWRMIFERNQECNKARMVAGYCWDWASKKNPKAMDVSIPEYDFAMRWNLSTDGNLWILKESSVNEIGCIHTCQGLELDYIGVIVGPDFIVRDGQVVTDATRRSAMDSSVKGYKKALKLNKSEARTKADEIIKNTYRTLMTRGQKGCYIFCADRETNEYFKAALRLMENPAETVTPQQTPVPFRVLDPDEVRPYQNAVPLLDLQAAAGEFSPEQWFEGCDWVELPEPFSAKADYFVVQVVGESMNRRIANGAWCLFRKDPGGSRNGKVVLVHHHDIQDPYFGRFTVKVYHSEKEIREDSWHHKRIILKPDPRESGYREIILEGEEIAELNVMGEYVASLAC